MDIKKFVNERFGIVRALTIKEDPWFVAYDVAIALGYKKPDQAVRKHVLEEDKKLISKQNDQETWELLTPSKRGGHSGKGGAQFMIIINEVGLYSLIMKSKLKSAYEFQRWVTGEVLPNIRKCGAHIEPSHEQIRAISKMIRAMEVSAISSFLKYSRKRGINHENERMIYANLSNLANKYSDIETGMRDKSGNINLLILITLEAKIMSTLYNNMVKNVDPEVIIKFVYTNVQETATYFYENLQIPEEGIVDFKFKDKAYNPNNNKATIQIKVVDNEGTFKFGDELKIDFTPEWEINNVA